MKQHLATPKKRLLATALLFALAQTAMAQDANQEQAGQQGQAGQDRDARENPTELDKVVVTGIRGSLESAMNLKRDAQGAIILPTLVCRDGDRVEAVLNTREELAAWLRSRD